MSKEIVVGPSPEKVELQKIPQGEAFRYCDQHYIHTGNAHSNGSHICLLIPAGVIAYMEKDTLVQAAKHTSYHIDF